MGGSLEIRNLGFRNLRQFKRIKKFGKKLGYSDYSQH